MVKGKIEGGGEGKGRCLRENCGKAQQVQREREAQLKQGSC